MSTRGPQAPRGRRLYIKGIGAVSQKRDGSFVFKSAPQRRSKQQSFAQQCACGTMTMAAVFTRLATAWEVQTSKEIAGQSGFTWKDQLIAMFYGTGVEFTDLDGVFWQGRRILAAEIQTLLDSISAAPGSILVRTDNGWAALLLGSPGTVLTVSEASERPDWLPGSGGGGGGVPLYGAGIFDTNDTVTVTSGTCPMTSVFVPQGFEASGVLIFLKGLGGGGGLNSVLYDANPSQPHNLLANSAQVVPAAPGLLFLPFTTTYTFAADAIAWFGIRSSGTSPTYATQNSSLARSPTLAFPPPATAPSISGTPTSNIGMILRGIQH
jgi:hypothetical protein